MFTDKLALGAPKCERGAHSRTLSRGGLLALLITLVLLTWAVKLTMVKGTLSQGPTWAWSGLLLAFRRANLAAQGQLKAGWL